MAPPKGLFRKSKHIGGTSSTDTGSSTAARGGTENRRESILSIQKGDTEAKDMARASCKSVSKASAMCGDLSADHLRHDSLHSSDANAVSARAVRHQRLASQRKKSGECQAFLETSSHYHKKWGRWLNGRLVVDKISCLQLEELVLQNPHSEKHLVKLGLRYARWSGTSLAAILLLEHASLMHENAPRTHEYWNSMGNAHLNHFLRNRKLLQVSKLHLGKCHLQQQQRVHLSQPAAISKTTTTAKKVKSMPSESFAPHASSGLLDPNMERPELRRKHSMEAFNKVRAAHARFKCVL